MAEGEIGQMMAKSHLPKNLKKPVLNIERIPMRYYAHPMSFSRAFHMVMRTNIIFLHFSHTNQQHRKRKGNEKRIGHTDVAFSASVSPRCGLQFK